MRLLAAVPPIRGRLRASRPALHFPPAPRRSPPLAPCALPVTSYGAPPRSAVPRGSPRRLLSSAVRAPLRLAAFPAPRLGPIAPGTPRSAVPHPAPSRGRGAASCAGMMAALRQRPSGPQRRSFGAEGGENGEPSTGPLPPPDPSEGRWAARRKEAERAGAASRRRRYRTGLPQLPPRREAAARLRQRGAARSCGTPSA